MSDQERLLKLIDDLGWMATLEVLQDWREWPEIKEAAIDQASDAGDVIDKYSHEKAIDELQAEIHGLEESLAEFSGESGRIYDAICEGRRDDAIEILTEITGDRFRSIREQHNLFPDRVPA